MATGLATETAGFAATTVALAVLTGVTFTVVGDGFTLTVAVCAAVLAFTAVCTFFCTTAGFCANPTPDAHNNEIARVRFIYVLPLALPLAGVATGAGASWLKHVVATHVATTLSFGSYLYACLAFASAPFLSSSSSGSERATSDRGS